jgi:hypothetical protein
LPENIVVGKRKKKAEGDATVSHPPSTILLVNDHERKLQQEVESWRPFAKALRLEDRQLLNRMLEKIWAFDSVVENSKEGYETEAFLLSLLILQQKTIDHLEAMLAKRKKPAR